MMRAPSHPDTFRPRTYHRAMRFRAIGLVGVQNRYSAEIARRIEPFQGARRARKGSDNAAGEFMRKAAFESEIEARQVNPDRLDCSSFRLAGMLSGVGIHGQSMDRHKRRVGILASQHLAIQGPA